MRTIVVVMAGLLICGTSFAKSTEPTAPKAPPSEDSVSLKGSKAHELKKLVNKFKSPDAPNQATLDVTCKYPNGPEDGGSEFCSISQAGTMEPSVNYNGNQAQRMRTLLESAHADVPDDSPCGAGSCHVKGAIKVICSSNSECHISEANQKSPKQAAPKPKKANATQ